MRQYYLIAFIITNEHFHRRYKSHADANIQILISSGKANLLPKMRGNETTYSDQNAKLAFSSADNFRGGQ